MGTGIDKRVTGAIVPSVAKRISGNADIAVSKRVVGAVTQDTDKRIVYNGTAFGRGSWGNSWGFPGHTSWGNTWRTVLFANLSLNLSKRVDGGISQNITKRV